MRVCLVADEFPPQIGGVGDYVFSLARELSRQRIQVTVLAPQGSIASDCLPFRVEPLWYRRSTSDMHRAFHFLRSGSFDVIHVHYCSNAFHWKHPGFINLLGALRLFTPIPLVVTFHELSDPYQWSLSGLLRPTIHRLRVAWVLALAHQRIVTTLGRERLLKRFLFPETVHCIEISSALPDVNLTPEQKDQVRREWGLLPQEVAVATFGRVEPAKGFNDLLQAASLLRRDGIGIRLLWIGPESNDAYQTHLLELEKTSSLNGAVIRTGRADLTLAATLIAASDLYAVPYRWGLCTRHSSFPVGLQQGIATITTLGPETPAYLLDGVNVRLTPPQDVRSLSQAMRELAIDPALRRQLGEKGRRIYAEHFSIESGARSTVKVYEQSLKGRRSSATEEPCCQL